MNAARVQLARDFGISDISFRNVLSSDPNKENDGIKENAALISIIDDEETINRIDGLIMHCIKAFNLLRQSMKFHKDHQNGDQLHILMMKN